MEDVFKVLSMFARTPSDTDEIPVILAPLPDPDDTYDDHFATAASQSQASSSPKRPRSAGQPTRPVRASSIATGLGAQFQQQSSRDRLTAPCEHADAQTSLAGTTLSARLKRESAIGSSKGSSARTSMAMGAFSREPSVELLLDEPETPEQGKHYAAPPRNDSKDDVVYIHRGNNFNEFYI